MVSKLSNTPKLPAISTSELPQESLKWCTVSLSDIIHNGKRLEASVFDVNAKLAFSNIAKCPFPKKDLFNENTTLGFIKSIYYGNRLKRNYISSKSKNAIGFIGSSEMLDIKPVPIKFMDKTLNSSKSLAVKEGTVLLSRSGTIGNLAYVNKTLSKLLVSEHAIRLECNEFPGYIYCFLKSDTGQALIQSKVYGAVVQQIEPKHLADIPIPDPPTSIKKKINNLIIHSYDLRDKSNELLDEAATILIDELHLPPIDDFPKERFDNTVTVNNYSTKLSQLNGRFDASYHIPIVKTIIEHLKKYAEKILSIGDNEISKKIILPGRFKRTYVRKGQGRIFFGGKQLYQLEPSNKKYLSLAKHKDRIKDQLELRENMTLITRSGTIGKIAMVPKHWEHWVTSEHIIRIIPTSNDIAGYIAVFLSSACAYPLITRFTYGSVVDEIDENHVSQIPFPLLKNKIAQHKINALALKANDMRYKAYKLEQEALQIMDNKVIFI